MNTKETLKPRDLQGKTVLLNGAGSSGKGVSNGMAAAMAYARAGARVFAVDISASAAAETVVQIRRDGGIAAPYAADVSEADAMRGAVDACLAEYADIDILHHNVGIARLGGPVEQSLDDWNLVLKTNLTSLFLACKYVLPVMTAKKSGAIIAISSLAGIRWNGTPFISYASTKAAMIQFTRSIALQYAREGIRANCIVPGLIDTPLVYGALKADSAEEIEAMRSRRNSVCPTGMMGSPWDIANAALFLASDAASYINGTSQIVDGGMFIESANNR